MNIKATGIKITPGNYHLDVEIDNNGEFPEGFDIDDVITHFGARELLSKMDSDDIMDEAASRGDDILKKFAAKDLLDAVHCGHLENYVGNDPDRFLKCFPQCDINAHAGPTTLTDFATEINQRCEDKKDLLELIRLIGFDRIIEAMGFKQVITLAKTM